MVLQINVDGGSQVRQHPSPPNKKKELIVWGFTFVNLPSGDLGAGLWAVPEKIVLS